MSLTYDEIDTAVQDLINQIADECDLVPASELGLDPRCGPIRIGQGYIMSNRSRDLDYYAGFQYLPNRLTIGTWTIYPVEQDASARVEDLIQRAEDYLAH